MIDTFWPLILPSWFGNPFYIFLLRQYFLTHSRELDQAAVIDGCSRFGVFWRITLPMSKPVLAAVAIFSFQFHWNDFFRPLIFLLDQDKYTLALGLRFFQGTYRHRMEFADGGLAGGDAAADHRLLLHAEVLHSGRGFHRLQIDRCAKGLSRLMEYSWITIQQTDTSARHDAVSWTDGFWGRLFTKLCRETVLPKMRQALDEPTNGAVFSNFYIAAGLQEGERKGTMWSDGDCYKYMEAMTHIYGATKEQAIIEELDELIDVIAQAQEDDGYISTPMQLSDDKERWTNLHDHELYNMGHLLTAAAVHHRITGQRNFLQIAIDLADYLYDLFMPRPPNWRISASIPPIRWARSICIASPATVAISSWRSASWICAARSPAART